MNDLRAFAAERLSYPEATWGERELARRILEDDGSLGEARELLRIALPIIHVGDPLLALRIERTLSPLPAPPVGGESSLA